MEQLYYLIMTLLAYFLFYMLMKFIIEIAEIIIFVKIDAMNPDNTENMREVIVYYMHEKEEAWATSFVTHIIEKNESFIKGFVSEDDIQNLVEKNLIFNFIDNKEN